MGGIIGGVIGGIGSLFGGSSSSDANNKAAQQSLTGYNYLTGAHGVTPYVNNGTTANNAETSLLTGTASPAQNQAFKNYLNSSGYNFELGQGQQAITGSAAARGLLNSGSTAKALTQYGTNLASTYFNNYLANLGNVAGQGLEASGQIGNAGTAGGGNAGTFTSAGGAATANGINQAANYFGGAVANSPSLNNFFGSI